MLRVPLRAERDLSRERPRPLFACFLFVFVFVETSSASVALAAPAAEVIALDLDQAVRRAREVSALVRRARGDARVTDARRVDAEVRLPANPGIAVSVGPRREESAGAPTRSGLGYLLHVEQAIEVGGQRSARMAEVERAVDAGAARERLAGIEAAARARSAYVAALLGTALVRSTGEREALAARLEESVRSRVDAGAASEIELRLAEVERGRMHRERVDAERLAGEAEAELLALLALPPDARVALTTPLAAPPTNLPPVDRAIADALERRADLAALAASAAEVDAQIVRLRREVLPTPALLVDVQRDLPGQMFVGGGLAVALPVWRRNQGAIARASAERARIDDEHILAARQIALEVDRAYRDVRAWREQARIQETEVLPAAERARDLLTQGWQAGKFDLFRVIQLSREAGEAHRHQIETLGGLWQATIELDRALGTP